MGCKQSVYKYENIDDILRMYKNPENYKTYHT